MNAHEAWREELIAENPVARVKEARRQRSGPQVSQASELDMIDPMPLEAALDLVQVEVAKHPPEAVFAAACSAQIALADRYGKKMIRSGIIGFTTRYTNGRDVLKALERHKPDVRECAIDILAVLDPPVAARLAAAVATAVVEPRAFAYDYERASAFETLARSRASLALNRLASRMSVEEVLNGMARRLLSVDLAGAALAANPLLQSGPQVLASLERTRAVAATLEGKGAGPDRDFAEWLVSRLALARHLDSAPLLARLQAATSGPLTGSPAVARAVAELCGGAVQPAAPFVPPSTPAHLEPQAAPTVPAAQQAAQPAAPADWLDRYRAGQHELVWAEICAADLSDTRALSDARTVAAEMMDRVRRNLELIVARLERGGFRFRARPLDAPRPDVGASIARIEELAGATLPLALRAFYEVVGAVDLEPAEHVDRAGDDDPVVPPFPGFAKCDPLVVYPAASAVCDVEEWHRHRSGPPRVVVSVEPDCKAVPANGSDAPYRIVIDGRVADASIEGAAGSPSFVAYLRRALRWGGFAGLAPLLDPLAPKSKAIARKKRRTLEEWRLIYAERLILDLIPF